ncbi:MAG: hypothetical protein QW343_04010 [Candidatus Norongarragalinales archaeon]
MKREKRCTRHDKCGFSLKHYAEILRKAKKLGYKIVGTREFARRKPMGRVLVLRHDIDFEPARALEMARVEKENGVRSTYFVRVHYDGYNPFGFKTNAVLRKLESAGHEVGLHYECNDYAHVARVPPSEALKREKACLEAALGHAVAGCAAHADFTGISNKTFFAKRKARDFGFEYEAFEKPFRELHYVSDSLGKWSEGKCLCKYFGCEKKLYVLTHPVYWFKESYHTG